MKKYQYTIDAVQVENKYHNTITGKRKYRNTVLHDTRVRITVYANSGYNLRLAVTDVLGYANADCYWKWNVISAEEMLEEVPDGFEEDCDETCRC
jgi:hypothetical protein